MITLSIAEFLEQVQNSGPLLGLDIGTARIGIALTDTGRIIASPFAVYERRNMSQDLGHLNKLATDEKAAGIVIGLPLELNGTENENCAAIRHFAGKLAKKTGLPILLQDERMSTAAATRALSESGMTRKKRQSLDDKMAAAFILQTIVDSVAARH